MLFFCLRLQYGLLWHFQCFCALCHMRTWYYLYGTLRKGEKASLGQNPTQPQGLRRPTPGLVHRHHQHGGLAGECWIRDLHASVQGPGSRGGRSSVPVRQTAWGSHWQPPRTICQMQPGPVSNQDPQQSD